MFNCLNFFRMLCRVGVNSNSMSHVVVIKKIDHIDHRFEYLAVLVYKGAGVFHVSAYWI